MPHKILFLVPYSLQESPSQRFRFEQYFDILKANEYTFITQSFLNSQNGQLFFESGKPLTKILVLALGFVRRFGILFTARAYDFVFIHREATPIGPPIIEWILAKILKRKIIYDFDDAIWLTDKVSERPIEKLIRFRKKIELICRWSYKVSCGNEYLSAYAKQFNSNVLLNPTTIDTLCLHNPTQFTKERKSDAITIGWTGSHSTLKYLDLIVPVIQQLEKRYSIQFLVIANQRPKIPIKSLRFMKWDRTTEAKDLMQIDIGIMPLPDDLWAQGKCGFKALQYMALEIAAVASPVGVNTKIITDKINGFLCSTSSEWYSQLEQLINDHSLREKLGKAGRQEVERNYSVSSNSSNFLSLFV